MWLGFKGLSSLEQHESSDGFSITKVAGCDLNTKSIYIIIVIIITSSLSSLFIYLFIFFFIYLHIHSLLFSDRSWVMNPSSSTFFSHKLLFSFLSFHKKRVTTFHIHCAIFFFKLMYVFSLNRGRRVLYSAHGENLYCDWETVLEER